MTYGIVIVLDLQSFMQYCFLCYSLFRLPFSDLPSLCRRHLWSWFLRYTQKT